MYRVIDKKAIDEFKEYLSKEVSEEERKYDWNFFIKNQYLNDLYSYTRTHSKENIVDVGFGDCNSSIVLVLDSLNEDYIKYFKEILPKMGIDFNSIYITFLNKSSMQDDTLHTSILSLELQAIKPAIVITIGNHLTNKNNFELIEIDKNNFDTVVTLNNKKLLTPEETIDMKTNKQLLWNCIKYLIKYYKSY